MRYLNKIIFLNSAHIPYAEVKLDAMYISLVRREWGRVHCSVLCCFSTMPINLSSASPRRRRVLMRSTFHIPILTLSMR